MGTPYLHFVLLKIAKFLFISSFDLQVHKGVILTPIVALLDFIRVVLHMHRGNIYECYLVALSESRSIIAAKQWLG